MSKILRRPMFRGGPVNSEGTGITFGLNEGYATGGRVGYQTAGLVEDYYDPISSFTQDFGLPINDPKIELEKEKSRIKSSLEPSSGYPDESGMTPMVPGKQPSRKELEFLLPTGQTKFIEEGTTKRENQIQNVIAASQNLSELQRKNLLKYYNITPAELTKFTKPIEGGYTGTDTGIGTSTGKDQNEISMDDVEARTEKYAKLLGYDKAKTQSIYDAMLAASPAFFKGRSFGETASGVLEAVNKSGAFDKPTNIKQAAAQLSIQREILMDKAKAEASAKMAELGYKKPSSLSDFYNANLKANQPVTEAKENAVRAKYGDSYREGVPFNKSTAKMGEIYKVPKNTADPKGPAMFIEINGQPPLGYKILIG
jgi:hypothetical protein